MDEIKDLVNISREDTKNTINYDFKYYNLDIKRIKTIERLIRKSFEYRAWTVFLKTTLDLSRCAFYEGYAIDNGFSIEIHHYPITLFDITYAVANKGLNKDGFILSNTVAEEVCFLHYLFNISVVPLSPAAHKLYHEGALPIHPDLVKGDYKRFLVRYNDFISDECKTRLEQMENDKKHDNQYKFPKILHKEKTYFKIEGFQNINDVNLKEIMAETSLKKIEEYHK
jgi:hypothetical protein